MFLFNKVNLRNQILKIRNNLTKAKQIELQTKIAENFAKLIIPNIDQNAIIAIYYSFGSELNIIPCVEKLKNQLLLPKIQIKSNLLKFYPWKIGDPLFSSKIFIKILEPENFEKELIPDIIIAPLIACDEEGNRLGSGKGIYDYTISKFRSINSKLLYIGICYDFQFIEKIPHEPHDEKLDIILTENRFINIKKSVEFFV